MFLSNVTYHYHEAMRLLAQRGCLFIHLCYYSSVDISLSGLCLLGHVSSLCLLSWPRSINMILVVLQNIVCTGKSNMSVITTEAECFKVMFKSC